MKSDAIVPIPLVRAVHSKGYGVFYKEERYYLQHFIDQVIVDCNYPHPPKGYA